MWSCELPADMNAAQLTTRQIKHMKKKHHQTRLTLRPPDAFWDTETDFKLTSDQSKVKVLSAFIYV